MTARGGFDYAQLDSGFLADPKFVRLARIVPDDETFLAAIGLWTVALAHAWARDDDDVSELLSVYPSPAAWLAEAGLLHGVTLVGYERKAAKMRARREADAARKRDVRNRPSESVGVRGSPPPSGGVPRVVVVEEVVEVSESPLRSVEVPPRARADGPRRTGLRPIAEPREV